MGGRDARTPAKRCRAQLMPHRWAAKWESAPDWSWTSLLITEIHFLVNQTWKYPQTFLIEIYLLKSILHRGYISHERHDWRKRSANFRFTLPGPPKSHLTRLSTIINVTHRALSTHIQLLTLAFQALIQCPPSHDLRSRKHELCRADWGPIHRELVNSGKRPHPVRISKQI